MPTTPERSYPYPSSTSAIDPPADFQALAEAIDTDVDGILTTSSTTDPGTVQSGFTVTTAYGVRALGGKIVHVFLELTNSSNLSVTSFNISDVSCYVTDAAYRPDANVYLPALLTNSGSIIGNVQMGPDGNVLIQTANATINAGAQLRMSWTFLKA